MINISDEAKKAFLTDGVKKEVFIEFPNNDHATITNSSIIKESLSFTESICSRDEFKFGLAEASTLEFECMNVDNIKGKTIRCRLRADGKYDVLLGTFIVDSCDREADMMKRKVVAYSKESPIDDISKNATASSIFEKNKYEMCLNSHPPYTYYSNTSVIAFDKESFPGTQIELDDKSRDITLAFKSSNSAPYQICEIYIECLKTKQPIFDNGDLYNSSYIYPIFRSDSTNDKIKELINQRQTIYNNLANVLSKLENLSTEEKYEILNSLDSILYTKLYPMVRYEYTRWSGGIGYVTEHDVWSGEDDKAIFPNVKFSYSIDLHAYLYIPHTFSIFVHQTNSKGETTEIYKYSETIFPEYLSYTQTKNEIPSNSSGMLVYDPNIFDLDYKDYMEAYAELNGLFGSYWRGNTFSFKKISNILGRYPSETLYPRNDIYPQDPNGGYMFRGNYISISYADKPIKFDRVTATFEDSNNETVSVYLQLVDSISNKPSELPEDNITEYISNYNSEDYITYSISYNSIIQNGSFDYDGIYGILKTIGKELKAITYMPSNIEMQGMPWLEAGDAIGIETKDGGIVTYILRRTLSGIWFLKDNIESR